MFNKHNLVIITKAIVVILLLFWCALFLIQQINLTTADLGRHIKNGEMVLAGNFEVLSRNFYSYAHPDYPFVNHHWLSGVVFFIIWQISGFNGLSIFYILLTFITLLIFFSLARQKASFSLTAVIAFVLIPLIADRQEIRPEIFTYLFSAIFLWLLIRHDSLCHPESNKPHAIPSPTNLMSSRHSKQWSIFSHSFLSAPSALHQRFISVLFLPVLMILWTNLHIGFIFGIFFISLFLLEALIKYFKNKNGRDAAMLRFYQRKTKYLLITLIVCFFAIFINPNGLKGALQPLNIFNEYGYQIVEHKSIAFLENYGLQDPNYLLVKLLIIALLISFILILIFKRKSFSLSYFILAITFSSLAYLAIRNFSHFGLIALPILAANTQNIITGLKNKFEPWYVNYCFLLLALLALAFVFNHYYDYLSIKTKNLASGLQPKNNVSAEFFQQEQIQGPIFNNYDIGSYLAFHLFPKHKIFVDNRPEAYPVTFFKETYIPMQEDEAIWQELNQAYNFNSIFFARHDITPWAQKFLINRAMDDEWIPVFYDQYAIIFLKDNEQNKEVIKQYEIPKSYFGVKQIN